MTTLLKALVDRLPGVSTPAMRGDNLAITLCTAFCDGDVETVDDSGWSQAARDGYNEVMVAIRDHFAPLADEIERLRAALGPLLSEEARQRILEEIESDEAMGSTQLAADLQILLDGDTKRRAILKPASPKGTIE